MATRGSGDVRIKWRGKEAEGELKSLVRPRLARCGSELRNHVVRKVSQGKTRTQGPSAPGEPPHIDEGNLRKNIFWWIDKPRPLSVAVGTTIDYGLHLEQGTRHMAARPYLRPSLDEMKPKLLKILAGNYKKG